jgi:hypothetical protein
MSQLSQSLEADLDMLLIKGHQLLNVVLFELLIVHQPEGAIPEDDLELAPSIPEMEEVHLRYILGWTLLLFMLVGLNFDGSRVPLWLFPVPVGLFGFSLSFIGND